MLCQSPRLWKSTWVSVLTTLAMLAPPVASSAAESHGLVQWTCSSGNMALLVLADNSARKSGSFSTGSLRPRPFRHAVRGADPAGGTLTPRF